MGRDVSKLKAHKIESWTNNEIQHMWHGGNNKLKEFLQGYGLTQGYEYDIGSKYNRYDTVACHYYRRWLESQALGQEFNESPPKYNYGRQLCNSEDVFAQRGFDQ